MIYCLKISAVAMFSWYFLLDVVSSRLYQFSCVNETCQHFVRPALYSGYYCEKQLFGDWT